MLNDEKIKEIISKYAKRGDQQYHYFYGATTASLGKMVMLANLYGNTNKYFIVGLNEKDLVVIGLANSGKPNGYNLIPRENIKHVKISNWLFGMGKKIVFDLEDGTSLEFKANKHCVGIEMQKENLALAENMLRKEGLLV